MLPEWRIFLDATGSAMCFFDGGFLPQFMDTLQFWYDRVCACSNSTFPTSPSPLQPRQDASPKTKSCRQNCDALRQAIRRFKQRNPDVLFAAFNGFGGDTEGTFAPIRQSVDLRWLEAFDSLYCGDPQFSDVPAMNFWRSMDIYSDHMVRYYEANGVPLERTDNTGCMFPVARRCYQRRTAAWKSMLLLEHARGGWMNVYYGNLELIDDAKAEWFAKVQKMYFPSSPSGGLFPLAACRGGRNLADLFPRREGRPLHRNSSQAVRVIRLPTLHHLEPPPASETSPIPRCRFSAPIVP